MFRRGSLWWIWDRQPVFTLMIASKNENSSLKLVGDQAGSKNNLPHKMNAIYHKTGDFVCVLYWHICSSRVIAAIFHTIKLLFHRFLLRLFSVFQRLLVRIWASEPLLKKIAFRIVCLIPFDSIVTSIGCQARGSGVQIYDVNDHTVVKAIKTPEGSGEYGIYSLVLSVDGTLLFFGCDSGSLVFHV